MCVFTCPEAFAAFVFFFAKIDTEKEIVMTYQFKFEGFLMASRTYSFIHSASTKNAFRQISTTDRLFDVT
jgi:hypothetical protein